MQNTCWCCIRFPIVIKLVAIDCILRKTVFEPYNQIKLLTELMQLNILKYLITFLWLSIMTDNKSCECMNHMFIIPISSYTTAWVIESILVIYAIQWYELSAVCICWFLEDSIWDKMRHSMNYSMHYLMNYLMYYSMNYLMHYSMHFAIN